MWRTDVALCTQVIAAAFLPGGTLPAGAAYCQYCVCGGDHPIELIGGRDVVVDGVTVQSGTSWSVKLMSLANVHVTRVKVIAHKLHVASCALTALPAPACGQQRSHSCAGLPWPGDSFQSCAVAPR